MDIGYLIFYGFIAWMVYMMTFRHKQFMELNDHMKGNVRDATGTAGKAAGVGFKSARHVPEKVMNRAATRLAC